MITGACCKKVFILLGVLYLFIMPSIAREGKGVVLGSASGGDGVLFMPFIAEEGPDGAIYVADAREVCIKVYSADGQYLRKISRPGQGPGDILRMGSFGFFDDKTLFTTEMINGNRWINFFDLSGKFLHVRKIDMKGAWGLFKAKKLSNGRLLGEFHFWGDAEKISRYYGLTYPQWLAVIEPDGKILQTPVRKKHIFSVSYEPTKGDKRIPFFPNFLWFFDEQQQRIYFSEGNSNLWVKLDLNGNILETIKTELPEAPPVTRDDIGRWKEELKNNVVKRNGLAAYKQYFSVIEDYRDSIHVKKPVYSSMELTPSGCALIRQESFVASGGAVNPARYWLLNKNGKVLLQFPAVVNSLKITGKHIIYIAENEEGEKEVHCIPRSGGETDDVSALKDNLLK